MATCFRHPEKKAKRKCYRCRRVICIDCYVQRAQHIFCSSRCWAAFMAAERIERLRSASGRRVPWPLFLVAAVAFAIVAAALLLSVTRELDAPISQLLRSRSPREGPVTAKITSMEEGEKAMTVTGRTAPGALVFLLHDGRAVQNGVADANGQFRFEVDLESAAGAWAAAAAPASAAASTFVPSPVRVPLPAVRSNQARFVGSFTRGATTQPALVLSFDAGSTDHGAREVLGTLREHRIRTTVFLTGDFIRRFPDVVKTIVADGHEVGNHTWSHPHLTSFARDRRQTTLPTMTRERLQEELRRTSDEFRRVTGRQMAPLWRAPFGEENSEIRGWATELGYLHVGWTRGRTYNLDALDWVADRGSPIYFTAEQLTERMLAFDTANHSTLNGGIVLMHLGSERPDEDQLSRALPLMIRRFEDRGFRFLTVSQMRRQLLSF